MSHVETSRNIPKVKLKITFILASTLFILTQFQNCSGVSFSSASTGNNGVLGGGGGPTCSTVIQNYQGDLRIIIMVDNSGSTSGTDPQYYYRKQTVSDFLTKYGSKTNFTYSFSEFANDATSTFDVSTGSFVSSPTTPFGSATNMNSALSEYLTIAIGGDTPYQAASDQIARLIANDAATGLVGVSYAVVFMSDGQPHENGVNGATTAQLKAMVDESLNAAKAKGTLATFSTVYFGDPTDTGSMGVLKTMATEGSGQFYDTNNPPPGGLIENVLTVPGQVQVCTQGT